jgi:hypothetical protein
MEVLLSCPRGAQTPPSDRGCYLLATAGKGRAIFSPLPRVHRCSSRASRILGLGPCREREEEDGGDPRPSRRPGEGGSYRGGGPLDLLHSED